MASQGSELESCKAALSEQGATISELCSESLSHRDALVSVLDRIKAVEVSRKKQE